MFCLVLLSTVGPLDRYSTIDLFFTFFVSETQDDRVHFSDFTNVALIFNFLLFMVTFITVKGQLTPTFNLIP